MQLPDSLDASSSMGRSLTVTLVTALAGELASEIHSQGVFLVELESLGGHWPSSL